MDAMADTDRELLLLCAAEAWYQRLRRANRFTLAKLLRTLQGRKFSLQSSHGWWMCMAIWLWCTADARSLQLTPCVRSKCKATSKRLMESNPNLTVFDGFRQQVSRFLFLPSDSFWDSRKTNKAQDSREQIEVQDSLEKIEVQDSLEKIEVQDSHEKIEVQDSHEKIEVQTILPNGVCEAKSWMRRGKGLFAYVRAADLDRNVQPTAPYSFRREDQTTVAVVKMWSKKVDEGFNDHFQKTEIKGVDDLQDAREKEAFLDFKQALVNLLTEAGLRGGTIWKCAEVQASENTHLAIYGKLKDVITALDRQPWVARHYFQCLTRQGPEGRLSFHANMGFGKTGLVMRPGKPDLRIVLYIRRGTGGEHACTQSLDVFLLDSRTPEGFSIDLIIGSFGRQFKPQGELGRGSEGIVYEVTEVTAEEEGLPFDQRKGILMGLADTSLDKFVLREADNSGKHLDIRWLQTCRDLMAQMVFAVAYMHQKRLVHRDLKPQNVLLNHSDSSLGGLSIMLSDFGCTAFLPPEQQRLPGGRRVGTPGYAAGEIEKYQPHGMKCDVFSLGVTFQAILQRRRGHAQRGLILMPDKHGHKHHSCNYPGKLVGLLQGMLKKDESWRYSILSVREDPFFNQLTWGSSTFAAVDWSQY
ncbi:unnamed protein product [Effrenium voratum]|uniref:Protein kinase domain-containing protein n=1 Tax=Effrenium voratum TaxID=2562239 RepID=A0AA36HYA7_9DINO|nr:unnamed protein product [Effrenium voratum]